VHVTRFKCEFVSCIQQISINITKISAKINTMQNINILRFVLCLEMLSSLVNCSVDNVQSEIRP